MSYQTCATGTPMTKCAGRSCYAEVPDVEGCRLVCESCMSKRTAGADYEPGDAVEWRGGPFDHTWKPAVVTSVSNAPDDLGPYWIVYIRTSTSGDRPYAGPLLKSCLRKASAQAPYKVGEAIEWLPSANATWQPATVTRVNNMPDSAGDFWMVYFDADGGGRCMGGEMTETHMRKRQVEPVSVTIARREIDKLNRTGWGEAVTSALARAQASGVTPGTRLYIEVALLALPGVTSAWVNKTADDPNIKPGEIAIVVDGGDPHHLSEVIRQTVAMGVRTLGTEFSDNSREPRWYTKETWGIQTRAWGAGHNHDVHVASIKVDTSGADPRAIAAAFDAALSKVDPAKAEGKDLERLAEITGTAQPVRIATIELDMPALAAAKGDSNAIIGRVVAMDMKTRQPAPGPVVYHQSKLDVEYEGVALRSLLATDEWNRHDIAPAMRLTPAQRAAVSAHWSAELRARMAAKVPSVVMPDHELETANCADAKDGES